VFCVWFSGKVVIRTPNTNYHLHRIQITPEGQAQYKEADHKAEDQLIRIEPGKLHGSESILVSGMTTTAKPVRIYSVKV
jgi:hypothetical protein